MSKLNVISKKNLKEIKGGQKDIIIEDVIFASKSSIDQVPTIKSSYDFVVDDFVVLP